MLFEHYYDVRGDGRDDEGFALVELSDGSGYAITGTSRTTGNNWAVHLLKIDCIGFGSATFECSIYGHCYFIPNTQYCNSILSIIIF